MSPTFRTGLVVGKFCPLHRGHQHLIDHAFEHCGEVVLLSYSLPEFIRCEPEHRERWLRTLYPQATILVIDNHRLALLCRKHGQVIRTMPCNSDIGLVHHEFIGWLCATTLGKRLDAVFTSEHYGTEFAAALSRYFSREYSTDSPVAHICCDPARLAVPVSGTQIRSAPHRYREYLAPVVYADFIERVAFIGGESSGKTTLAEQLAQQLGTCWVPEYGRELWTKLDGRLAHHDLLQIAQVQVAREETLAQQAHRWLFCDTTPLTTLLYSQELFGPACRGLVALARRRYDHVFLCAPDFDFVQDGTRRDDDFRRLQHRWYLRELEERGVSFTVLTGSIEDRVACVLASLLYGTTAQAASPAYA